MIFSDNPVVTMVDHLDHLFKVGNDHLSIPIRYFGPTFS